MQADELHRRRLVDVELRQLTSERDELARQLTDAEDRSTSLANELHSVKRDLARTAADLEAAAADRDRRLEDAAGRVTETEDDVRRLRQTVSELKVEKQVSCWMRNCLYDAFYEWYESIYERVWSIAVRWALDPN